MAYRIEILVVAPVFLGNSDLVAGVTGQGGRSWRLLPAVTWTATTIT
jgi:hypothetical protein